MSDLYLSIGALSQTPYYLSGLGVNIYSMDELCFYLVENAYILDAGLVDITLCDFISNELELKEIGEKIKELVINNKTTGEIVTEILGITGYCSEDENKRIRQILVDNATLSFAAKRKAKGDNMIKANKYIRAIEEYQYVLSNEKWEDEPELCSAILHNIACAYSRMFMFDKVAEYFKKAYELDGNNESLTLYLAAMRMSMKKEDFDRMVVRCGYDERIVIEAQKRLSAAENTPPDGEYVRDVQMILDMENAGDVAGALEGSSNVLDKWKQDYRRSMGAGYH